MTYSTKRRMSRLKRTYKAILGWIALIAILSPIAYMIADIGGFLMWEYTGQIPPASWYFGSITQFIINLFI